MTGAPGFKMLVDLPPFREFDVPLDSRVTGPLPSPPFYEHGPKSTDRKAE